MARPLRINVAGGWYHVTARGQRRERILNAEADYRRLLKLVAEMRERHRVRVRAYCLMPNHYHLLVSTPEANLSRAVQWLNVSYSRWLNSRRGDVGPVFQGRFGAVLLESGYGLAVSQYIHMNPVSVSALGLDKQRKAAEGQGMASLPAPEVLRGRVETLRKYPWSSFRAYAGYEKPPPWLDCGAVLAMVKGGESGYRELLEGQVLQGAEEDLGSRVRWGLVLGSERFARKVRGKICIDRESLGRGDLKERRPFAEIVKLVEGLKREKWALFRDRYNDWGRDLALWGGRLYGGLTLAELGREAGGLDYATVSVATARLVQKAKKDHRLRKAMAMLKAKCEK